MQLSLLESAPTPVVEQKSFCIEAVPFGVQVAENRYHLFFCKGDDRQPFPLQFTLIESIHLKNKLEKKLKRNPWITWEEMLGEVEWAIDRGIR